jgi:hypothetical protein
MIWGDFWDIFGRVSITSISPGRKGLVAAYVSFVQVALSASYPISFTNILLREVLFDLLKYEVTNLTALSSVFTISNGNCLYDWF